MTDKKTTNEKQTFEEALGKLEKIVDQMDGGDLGLDDMIAKFEQGSELIKTCSDKLNEVERKIEKLVKKDGEVVAEPFEENVEQ